MRLAARELIAKLGNRFSKPRNPPGLRVLGICTPGEVHSVALLMLLELLRQDGIAATFVGEQVSKNEVYAFANRFAPDMVCLTCNSACPTPLSWFKSLCGKGTG